MDIYVDLETYYENSWGSYFKCLAMGSASAGGCIFKIGYGDWYGNGSGIGLASGQCTSYFYGFAGGCSLGFGNYECTGDG